MGFERMNNTTDFRFRRTLSAGEAEPPRISTMLVTNCQHMMWSSLPSSLINATCGVSTFSLILLESPPSAIYVLTRKVWTKNVL